MVDFISDYLETIEKRQVTPSVKPNWLKEEIPLSAPNDPEPFAKIMQDVDEKIMPGVCIAIVYSSFICKIIRRPCPKRGRSFSSTTFMKINLIT